MKLKGQWGKLLSNELNKSYMQELLSHIEMELQKGVKVYPKREDIFSAFNLTPFENVKVVIIGQDPYHGENQAHGLSFSVRKGVKIPPSLKNIYKELNADLGFKIPSHGDLSSWAKQGVLLLNSTLTVEASKAGSHRDLGWEIFTDKVIELLNTKKEGIVFLLWGSPAQKKARILDENKHLILKSVHPSPLSAYRGFFGNNHFSKTNKFLLKQGKDPISWDIVD